MAPHRSNRKGDLGNYRPISSAADIDNIFLTEEGWVYRHFKGNPNLPETRYWDEIIVAGQVDRDEERPSRNPIDYGTVIDNEPMLDTLNASPSRKYLGLGDTPDANSVDGYDSESTGYGTGEIQFETVIDGVNRVIGLTDGCFDYDYKHGTCQDDGSSGGGGGGSNASGKISIDLVQLTTTEIKQGDTVDFKVVVAVEDGATDCSWKVAVATTTRFSGELASGVANETGEFTFSAEASAVGIFNIEAIAIAKDTEGETISDADTLTNVEVKPDLATGSCSVQFDDGPYAVDKGEECVANVTHQVFDGATFSSIELSSNQSGSITDVITTTNGDNTEFRFKGGAQSGVHELKAIFKALDSKGVEITPACIATEAIEVFPQTYFRYKAVKSVQDADINPLDTFEIELISTSLQGVDRYTVEYKVTNTTGDITVTKIGETDRTTDDDITTFRVEVKDTASGQCRIYFNGAGKSESGLKDIYHNLTESFNINTPTDPYFYDVKFGWLDANEDFATTDQYLDWDVELVNNGDKDQGIDDVDPITVCYYHVMGADGESVDALSDYTYSYTNVFNGSSVGFLDGDNPAQISYDGLTEYTRDSHPDMHWFTRDADLQKLYVEKFTVTFGYNACTNLEQFEEWFDVSYTDSNGDDIYDADYWDRNRETVDSYIAFADAIYDNSATGPALLTYTGLNNGTEFYVNESNSYLYDLYDVGEVETNFDEVKAVFDSIDSNDFVLDYEEGKDDPQWNKPIWHKKYEFQIKATAKDGAYFEEDEGDLFALLQNHTGDDVPGRSDDVIELHYDDTVVSSDGSTITADASVTIKYWNDPEDLDDNYKIRVGYANAYGCDDDYIRIEDEYHEFRVERPSMDDISDVQEFDMTLWSSSKPSAVPDTGYGHNHEIFASGNHWKKKPEHPWNNLIGETPFIAKVNYDESTITSNLAFGYFYEPYTLYNQEYWELRGDLSELSYKVGDDNYITVWDEQANKRIKVNIDYYFEELNPFGRNADRPFLDSSNSHPRIQIDVGNGYEDYNDQPLDEGDTFKIKVEIDLNPDCDFTMNNVRMIGSLYGTDYDKNEDYYGEVTSSTTLTSDMLTGEFECTMVDRVDRRVKFTSLVLIEKEKAGEDTIKIAYPQIRTLDF